MSSSLTTSAEQKEKQMALLVEDYGKYAKMEPNEILAEADKANLNTLAKEERALLGNALSWAITRKIDATAEKIEEAKENAENAGAMKTGLFGKTGKKATATAVAVVATNEALVEMNEMIRTLVTYTRLNAKLSGVMRQAMAKMIAEGFKNQDGQLKELNKNGEEFANVVLGEAEDFTNRQLEIEILQAKQQEQLAKATAEGKQQAEKLEQEIQKLEEASKQHLLIVQKDIDAKMHKAMNRSDENDALHAKQISELQGKAANIDKASSQQDEIHTQQINDLQAKTEELEKRLREQCKKTDHFMTEWKLAQQRTKPTQGANQKEPRKSVVSIIALILSLISLGVVAASSLL